MEYQFPPPNDEHAFETFCCRLLKVYWHGADPQRMDALEVRKSEDADDARLESARQRFDEHDHQGAKLILRQLQTNRWSDLSEPQRFLTLTYLAKVEYAEGDWRSEGTEWEVAWFVLAEARLQQEVQRGFRGVDGTFLTDDPSRLQGVLALFDRAVNLAENSGNEWMTIRCLLGRGRVHHLLGQQEANQEVPFAWRHVQNRAFLLP
jgi:hypothetical protein